MKSLRITGYVLVAAALVGALWFLYSKTQSTDFARENLIIADLRELEALDAEWTTDSLRAKTGINHQFAAGQTSSERATKTSERIASAIRGSGLADAQAKFAAVNAVLAQKNAITKRFAEQNRILRESLLFVTDESADLLALLRVQQRDALQEKGGKGLQTVADLSELGVRINELLTETLKYNRLSDPSALKRIESNLADVTALHDETAELSKVHADYFDGKLPEGHTWMSCVDGDEMQCVAYYAPTPFANGVRDLLMIAVHPKHQRQGLGTLMLQHIEKRLQANDQRMLLVETSGLSSYGQARAFYKKYKFEQEACIRDFYLDGESKVIFRKMLGNNTCAL